jgi:hypothetical protein
MGWNDRDCTHALVSRADILEQECQIKRENGVTWNGRLKQLEGFGQSGGSSLDRILIVSKMAELESSIR